jgi:hypothetical protein
MGEMEMINPYAAFCEDFYINMRLGSQLELPKGRETVLHFFERIQKSFPGMGRFRRLDNGEYNIEEDRNGNCYRWASLEPKRLACGHVNPTSVEEAVPLHRLLLEMAPHHLGISPLEIDYLDVLLGFDMSFSGNHDEVVAESLLGDAPLASMSEEYDIRAVDFQPTITFALSDDCRLQARLDVVTRTNSYQVRTGDYSDEAISVYLIIRRYWGDGPKAELTEIFDNLVERAQGLCESHVLPRILRPLSAAIASRS